VLHLAKSRNDNSERDEGRGEIERGTARSRAETIAETRDDARYDARARRIEWREAARLVATNDRGQKSLIPKNLELGVATRQIDVSQKKSTRMPRADNVVSVARRREPRR
jgi:hypothetical protein